MHILARIIGSVAGLVFRLAVMTFATAVAGPSLRLAVTTFAAAVAGPSLRSLLLHRRNHTADAAAV
jgi:uncharacterized membrane protein YfcA